MAAPSTQMSVVAWAKSNKNEVPVVKPIENYRFETQLGRVDQRVIKLVGEDKQKSLRHMAEATVLSDFCPMVQVDKSRFQQGQSPGFMIHVRCVMI